MATTLVYCDAFCKWQALQTIKHYRKITRMGINEKGCYFASSKIPKKPKQLSWCRSLGPGPSRGSAHQAGQADLQPQQPLKEHSGLTTAGAAVLQVQLFCKQVIHQETIKVCFGSEKTVLPFLPHKKGSRQCSEFPETSLLASSTLLRKPDWGSQYPSWCPVERGKRKRAPSFLMNQLLLLFPT